jgi:hypothetical protein
MDNINHFSFVHRISDHERETTTISYVARTFARTDLFRTRPDLTYATARLGAHL